MNIISRELINIARQINADEDFSHYYDNKIQKYKTSLIKHFDSILKRGKLSTTSSDFGMSQIYNILTDSSNDSKQCQWFNNQIEKNYQNEIKKLKPIMDNNWANFIPNMNQQDHEYYRGNANQTYNIYYTFQFKQPKDVGNFINFMKNIYDMMNFDIPALGEPVVYFSCKTHAYLKSLLTHNDSFKIFYYDKDLKDDITTAISKLINQNNLKTVNRPYFNGKDVKEKGNLFRELMNKNINEQQYRQMKNNIGSFGQRLSKTITYKIIDLINTGKENEKKKGKNLTAQDCYNWFKTNFINLVKYASSILS